MNHVSSYSQFINEFMDESEFLAVHSEGVKYFPKLKYFETTLKHSTEPVTRFFVNYPKNGGSYSIGQFKGFLAYTKIELVLKWLSQQYRITDQVRSMTTHSVYFKINGTDIRMSDHNSGKFEGSSFIITWKDDPQTAFEAIKNAINK